jgi:NAD(P)-dependent dehydrogenase (short-subunit alcohol dehydrogenase family)
MSGLEKQVAIISGALGDIGRAIVLELAHLGAEIGMGDVLDPVQAGALLRELDQLRCRARYDRVDVADADAVTAWVQVVESDLGVPTLIIPNAATVTIAGISQITAKEWNRELRINLDGAFHLAQAGALRLLHHGKAGRIVFIGSWAGHAPHPFIPAYSVAKAGLRMLCKCMALELADRGILVNEVAPGYVDAGLARRWYEHDPSSREKDRRTVPIHQLIKPEEVAFQVAHLCDPRSRHFTGCVLLMDGGLSLLSGGGVQDG